MSAIKNDYCVKLCTKACDKFESKQENVIQNYE